MKANFLNLVDQVESIKNLFHINRANSMLINIISDRAEFIEWKQEIQFELHEIYDRTHDRFILDTLTPLKNGFKGWGDEKEFNNLSGSLNVIRKNIDRYYPVEKDLENISVEVNAIPAKSPKVFISHSSEDINFVSPLVDLLEAIGLRADQLFCSSVPGYGIPLDEDIYEFLKQQFHTFDMRVVFVLSENYYNSVACLNEMGAAWVLQSKNTIILLPYFEFREIRGAVNPRQIGIKIGADTDNLKEKLRQLKDILVHEFGLLKIPEVRWEVKRDVFITAISQQVSTKQNISDKALLLLQTACEDKHGVLIKTKDIAGIHIVVNQKEFTEVRMQREIATWEASFAELVERAFICASSQSGEVFKITKNGYDYIDQIKK